MSSASAENHNLCAISGTETTAVTRAKRRDGGGGDKNQFCGRGKENKNVNKWGYIKIRSFCTEKKKSKNKKKKTPLKQRRKRY